MLPLAATSKKQGSDFKSEILRLTRLWPSFGVAGTAAAIRATNFLVLRLTQSSLVRPGVSCALCR
jgi:hypothetical protein